MYKNVQYSNGIIGFPSHERLQWQFMQRKVQTQEEKAKRYVFDKNNRFAFISNRTGTDQIHVHWLEQNKTAVITDVERLIDGIQMI